MRLPSSLLLLLLTVAPLTTSATPSRAVKRLHNLALKHSSGFARNLRVAFQPILVAQPSNITSQKKLFCVSHKPGSQIGATGNGIANSNSTNTAGSSATPSSAGVTSTKTAGGSNPTQTQSSRFKLVESHVRSFGGTISHLVLMRWITARTKFL